MSQSVERLNACDGQSRGCSSRLNPFCADVPWKEGDSDAERGKH